MKKMDIRKEYEKIAELKKRQDAILEKIANVTKPIECYDAGVEKMRLSEDNYAIDFDGNKYTEGCIPVTKSERLSAKVEFNSVGKLTAHLYNGKDERRHTFSMIGFAESLDEMIDILELQKKRIDVLISGCKDRKKVME